MSVCLPKVYRKLFISLETLPAAAGGNSLSTRAVAVLQNTRGEMQFLAFLSKSVCWAEDWYRWASNTFVESLTPRLARVFTTGGRQLLAVCARHLWEGPSVDDRLWEDGPAARPSDFGPQDGLGGGQQRGRLPVGTGQPHRHLQQHAPSDALKDTLHTCLWRQETGEEAHRTDAFEDFSWWPRVCSGRKQSRYGTTRLMFCDQSMLRLWKKEGEVCWTVTRGHWPPVWPPGSACVTSDLVLFLLNVSICWWELHIACWLWWTLTRSFEAFYTALEKGSG